MKILHIRFENLNSLRGTHEIDLEQGPLAEAGIYSITGPTGAGKSTILDAITLALFGKAARYESDNNPGEVMTRGQGHCSAEVVFACGQGRYIATWSRARARSKADGKLQNAKRQIAEYGSGHIIAEKLREADQIIESLTGLDYERFLRSVLLAQGRFKEFLDANDNERGDLLEKITGTAIYSLIGAKTFEIHRDKTQAIADAKNKLAGLQLKTTGELSELQAEQCELKKVRTEAQKTLDQLATKLEKLRQRESCRHAIDQKQKALAELAQREQSFQPQLAKLQVHEQTLPFLEDLNGFQFYEAQAIALEKEITSLAESATKAESQAAAQLQATLAKLDSVAGALQRTRQQQQQKREATEALKSDLSAWLKEHVNDQSLAERLPNLQESGEFVRNLADKLSGYASRIRENTGLLEKNAATLQKAEAALKAAEKAKENANAAFKLKDQAYQNAASGKSMDEWHQAESSAASALELAQSLANRRQTWAERSEQSRSHQEQLPVLEKASARAQAAQAEQAKVLAQTKSTFEDKQRLLQQARLIASLESHRHDLSTGKPCPLCGAIEHPYAKDLPEDTTAADAKALDAQKTLLQEAEAKQQACAKEATSAETQYRSQLKLFSEHEEKLKHCAQLFKEAAAKSDYPSTLEATDAFAAWLESKQAEHRKTREQLKNLSTLNTARQSAETEQSKASGLWNDKKKDVESAQKEAQRIHNENTELKQLEQSTSGQVRTALEAFNQLLGPSESPASTPADTKLRYQALHTRFQSFQAKEKSLRESDQQLTEIRHKIEVIGRESQQLEHEASAYNKHLTSFAEILQQIDKATIPAISDEPQQRQDACERLLSLAQKAQQRLESKSADLKQTRETLGQKHKAILSRLNDSPFESLQALQQARLTEADVKAITAQKEALSNERNERLGQIKQLSEQLEALNAQDLPEQAELPDLAARHKQAGEQLTTIDQRIGAIESTLQADAAARSAQATQIKAIEALEAELRPWAELNRLIGSATGDKFSKFAQGLTLEQLLQLANQHLLALNERYQIRRGDPATLELRIVDRYQPDAIRPTQSLSGGESFLVSLALALGLSDLAGNNTRIESLFIDEGFGTLDAHTLDSALAALENLRTENRTIGIISHVEALKQRISAQIEVSKNSNGYGKLEVTLKG